MSGGEIDVFREEKSVNRYCISVWDSRGRQWMTKKGHEKYFDIKSKFIP